MHMSTTLVGSGVYDAVEAGRLLGVPATRVVRWAAPGRRGLPPVVAPSFERAFSFQDLISLAVVEELWERQVVDDDMRRGVAYLQQSTHHDKPLAYRDVVELLATSGRSFIAHIEGAWVDLGKGGQGAFKQIVRIYLERITFDDLGAARLWRPARHVVLDPEVQAGTPCVEGTRIPTATVAAMAAVDPPKLVAEELDLSIKEVEAAAHFEAALLEGRGIAA